MKQKKCKLAFKGRWVHNLDTLKYEELKIKYGAKYNLTEKKKQKLDKAESKLKKCRW